MSWLSSALDSAWDAVSGAAESVVDTVTDDMWDMDWWVGEESILDNFGDYLEQFPTDADWWLGENSIIDNVTDSNWWFGDESVWGDVTDSNWWFGEDSLYGDLDSMVGGWLPGGAPAPGEGQGGVPITGPSSPVGVRGGKKKGRITPGVNNRSSDVLSILNQV